MPIVLEPNKPKKGPGSAIGCRTKKGRRRRTAPKTQAPPGSITATSAPASIEDDRGFIGQELIRWDKDQQNSSGERIVKQKSVSKAPRSSTREDDFGSVASPGVAPPQRRALALDTRFLTTHPGIGQEILQEYQSFIETLSHRGIAPDIVASTTTGRNEDVSVQIVKSKTPVEATIPPMEDRGEEGVCLPQTFSAATTWSVFFDLVEAILKHKKDKEPIDLTILSTDLALFSDAKKDDHIASFEDFWNRILPHFEESRVSRIRLVVAKKNVVETNKGGSPKSEEGNEHPINTSRHQEAAEECIQALREKLDELEFSTPTADFAFHSIESSALGYRAMSRELVREDLSMLHYRVAFDLPESLDGTQCCVSFLASYQTFPYPIGSKQAEGLRDEFRTLSRQKLEVVQSVALSSVDAGLLYGVPLSLRAGIEGSIDEFHEMEVLSRVLFRLLCERELALVLRACAKSIQGLVNEHNDLYLLMAKEFPATMKRAPQAGLLFRYANANQLLAEAAPAAPCPSLEEEIEYMNYIESAIGRLDCEPFNPLDLVSNANSPPMVTLKCAPSNHPRCDDITEVDSGQDHMSSDPSFLTEQVDVHSADQGPSSRGDQLSNHEEDVWNDSAGVGSRAQIATQDLPEPMETDGSDDDECAFDFS